MLPFTKRPGRDESGENDVVMKDDLAKPPASIPPPPVSVASKRSVPPPSASSAAPGPPVSMRPKFLSAGEEEMTTLMPTKSLGTLNGAPSVRPAAGAPPPTSSKPAPSSRPGKFAASDEDEDGRTIVRGAPKIVKRTGAPHSNRMGLPTAPTTINPAAVIKASLDAARAGIKKSGDHLMAGPPSDLLEDLADRTGGAGGSSSRAKPVVEFHPADVGADHTAILQAPVSSARGMMIEGVKALSTQAMNVQPMPQGSIPPGSVRPLTNPPPPNPASSQNLVGYGSPATQSGGYAAQANQSGGYAAQANQSGGYNGSITGGSSSVPGVQMPPQSMPAHFMVPHAPYSDARMDPPGTAVTSRTRVAGRPAMSWALALAAFGLFVGVGAVAAMNNNEGFAQTSASFVDPSRAGAAPKSAAAGGQAAPTPVPVPAAGDPATAGVPPVAVPAGADPGTVAAPVVTTPAAPAVAAAPAAAVPAAAAAPAAVAAAPAAKVAPAPVAAAPRPQPAPDRVARPAARPAEEKEPVAAAPAKPGKKGAGGKADNSAVDEETRKALDALQKSQLESSF